MELNTAINVIKYMKTKNSRYIQINNETITDTKYICNYSNSYFTDIGIKLSILDATNRISSAPPDKNKIAMGIFVFVTP